MCFYQPQYYSNIQKKWCDIQGFKDRETGATGLIEAEDRVAAVMKFNKWIGKRFDDHSQLITGEWRLYSYYMKEVKS